jgi:hypothetical protein
MPAIVTATVAGASLWISVAMNSYDARLPQIQLLEEVAALGIDSDEGREIDRPRSDRSLPIELRK